MRDLHSIWLLGVAAVMTVMIITWAISVRKHDASIVDTIWGPGFVLAAWVYFSLGAPTVTPQVVLLALVTIWGVRLGLYIGWRNHGKDEDYRYQAMRAKHGASFRWRSLYRVFLLQGTLIAIISLPLLFALAQPRPSWQWTDFVGLGLWSIGFVFEAVGDRQLARFLADPANDGKVMRRGLWAYTRHPNYFGEALMWWGFYAFALAAPNGIWTFPAPLIMNLLLLKVSGVALLEKSIGERRPKYRAYVEEVNAFIPGRPKTRGGVG